MAVGGMMGKGNIGSRGIRAYGMMLLLAFGAAVFGVMVLHWLRERRISNILIKQKDSDLLTLHLLLQKERDSSKETLKQTDEMKAKIHSLTTQNMELDRRVLEMQSTVSSLKDEQKAMESALEEKQSEIRMLREKETNASKEDRQLTGLRQSLKQKEDEIENLKHQLDSSAKIWSVSTDDPSNLSVSLTSQRDHEPTNQRDDNSREELKDKDTAVKKRFDRVQGNKNKDSQDGARFKVSEGKNTANATEVIHSQDNQVSRVYNEGGEVKSIDETEHETTTERKQEKHKTSQGGESQRIGKIPKGGIKLEMSDSSQNIAIPRVKGKHGLDSKTKRNRWRIHAKGRGTRSSVKSDNIGAASMRTEVSNLGHGSEKYMAQRLAESNKVGAYPADDRVTRRITHDSDQDNMKWEKGIHSSMEVSADRSVHAEARETARQAGQMKLGEVINVDDNAKQETSVDDGKAEDLNNANIQEPETNFFKQATPKLEEDKDEYGEETMS